MERKSIIQHNKKGQIGTFLPFMIVGMVIILIFVVVAIPVAYMNDELVDAFQDELDVSNSTNDTMEDVQGKTTAWFDQVVFFVIVAYLIGAIVIAIMTDYNPVVIVAMILVMVIMVILAGLFSNVTNEVSTHEILANKSAEFTFTNAVTGTQFPTIILILGVVTIVIMLSKRGRSRGGSA